VAVIRHELADRIFTGKILTRELFIDNRHGRRIRVIMRREGAAFPQRYLESFKIIRQNNIDSRRRPDGWFRTPRQVHIGSVAAAAERQRDVRGGGFHARQRRNAINQAAEE
jgi:hypothetical protein